MINLNTTIIDYRSSDLEVSRLEKITDTILLSPKCASTYEAIDGHPDIQFVPLDTSTLLINKDIPNDFIQSLKSNNIDVLYSTNIIYGSYPTNIILNAVNLDSYFIHNLNFTDKTLLNHVKHKTLIDVKQGYTKCSTAVVSNTALITSDPSIMKSIKNTDLDALYIPPGDIILPGFDYGFIGGTCGLIDNNVLAFFGSLDRYEHKDDIYAFLKKHKVEPYFLNDSKLIDRGSIISMHTHY